jgi:hypothetical protein
MQFDQRSLKKELGCLESFECVRSDRRANVMIHHYEYIYRDGVDPDFAVRTALGIAFARSYGHHSRGPRGGKRLADVIGNAVKVVRIADGGEIEELETDRPKSAAAELGSRGGKAGANKLTPKECSAIARKAAKARWASGGVSALQ